MILIRTMLIAVFIFPIFSQRSHLNAQTQNTSTTTAKSRLDQAIKFLGDYHSIQGEITYQADLLGQQINGQGSYAELRTKPIPYMRMELKIPLDDKMGALVKVCDGRYLWTYRKVLDHEQLEQIDMDRVQEALEKKLGTSPTGHSGLVPDATLTSLGVGGLTNMLRQLNENFDFAAPTKSKLESKLDRMPVLRLEGMWNRKNLLRLLPRQKTAIEQGKAPDLSKLPPHIPDRVVVSLGGQHLFPYRIDYLRTDKKGGAKTGEGRGALMTIYFYNVQFDQPISETYFDYRPGDLEPEDKTHDYIKKLK